MGSRPTTSVASAGSARAADLVARLGHHRFGVLLPETDEIRAINYVERVRLACDAWLEAAAVSVRLSIGWASAPTGGDLAAAFAIAERRMYSDRSSTRTPTGSGAAPDEATAAAGPSPDPAPDARPFAAEAPAPSPVVADAVPAQAAEPGEIPTAYAGWGGPTSGDAG